MEEGDGACYTNMQHAIVEAIHRLGPASPFGDGSVRMKDLYAAVANSPIEVQGEVDRGPHRFSIFNSAICGRRSAAELFERVEDSNSGRQGAWWRLRMPYEKAVDFAKEQKSFATLQTRNRQRVEPGDTVKRLLVGSIEVTFDRSEMLESLEAIRTFVTETESLKQENAQLKQRSTELGDEIARLSESAPGQVMNKVKVYRALVAKANQLREIVISVQEQFSSATDRMMNLQGN